VFGAFNRQWIFQNASGYIDGNANTLRLDPLFKLASVVRRSTRILPGLGPPALPTCIYPEMFSKAERGYSLVFWSRPG
jgi:hypothetical protein